MMDVLRILGIVNRVVLSVAVAAFTLLLVLSIEEGLEKAFVCKECL